jgi:hypothetical protein
MVSFSSFTSGTYRVTLVTNPGLRYERGQDLNYNIQLSYPLLVIALSVFLRFGVSDYSFVL